MITRAIKHQTNIWIRGIAHMLRDTGMPVHRVKIPESKRHTAAPHTRFAGQTRASPVKGGGRIINIFIFFFLPSFPPFALFRGSVTLLHTASAPGLTGEDERAPNGLHQVASWRQGRRTNPRPPREEPITRLAEQELRGHRHDTTHLGHGRAAYGKKREAEKPKKKELCKRQK
ncbi:hypothetical protein F5X96DRAFT_615445 [Biscogniauxia mediterranea]|nr:hypothetical protein F5X96DRAFT_615445 [Biscogniauxia mediterranea]